MYSRFLNLAIINPTKLTIQLETLYPKWLLQVKELVSEYKYLEAAETIHRNRKVL